ncbi:MAG: IPExxxVDY family protein [Bacteroidetes bacterium]|nr:IPExxxVDY family protein [Bacteroidota bacterium]
MGKYTLEIEYDYDFVLIGISSHEKDYRICWALNNKLGFNLVKIDPLEIKDKKQDEPSHFSLFSFEQPDAFMEYFIIANRSEKGLLIPEQKQVDYFFIIRGEIENENVMEIVRQIKESNLVQTAFRIDVNALKSKQNLIL